jgi:hypothetical protein
MQSPNEENQNNVPAEQRLRQELERLRQDGELSEAWRLLLGLQPSEQQEGASEVDPTAQVPPVAGDPWSHLLQAQGMQSVDLQKIHLHDLYPEASDDDVEQALNLMREATGKLRTLSEKAKEE